MQNYIYMWKTAFDFKGRERRSVYWAAILTNLGISLIAYLIFCSIKNISIIGYIYLIAMIEPCIAITVRRLHDVNKSGKTALLLLVPIVGWTIVLSYLICDSTPSMNFYGYSIKYPKNGNSVTFSEEDISNKYKHGKKDDTVEIVTNSEDSSQQNNS